MASGEYENLILFSILAFLSWKYRIPYRFSVWMGLTAAWVAALAAAYDQSSVAEGAATMAFNFIAVAVVLAIVTHKSETTRTLLNLLKSHGDELRHQFGPEGGKAELSPATESRDE